jgi:hypothetical protein
MGSVFRPIAESAPEMVEMNDDGATKEVPPINTAVPLLEIVAKRITATRTRATDRTTEEGASDQYCRESSSRSARRRMTDNSEGVLNDLGTAVLDTKDAGSSSSTPRTVTRKNDR